MSTYGRWCHCGNKNDGYCYSAGANFLAWYSMTNFSNHFPLLHYGSVSELGRTNKDLQSGRLWREWFAQERARHRRVASLLIGIHGKDPASAQG